MTEHRSGFGGDCPETGAVTETRAVPGAGTETGSRWGAVTTGPPAGAVTLVLRLGLAAVFLVAGVGKLADPVTFAEQVAAYHLVPSRLVTLVAVTLPGLEVVVGLSLLLGGLTEAGACLVTLLAGGFGVAVGSALVRGLEVDCGCFAGPSPISWWHVGLDLALLIAALWVWRRGPGLWALDRWLLDD